MTLTAIAKCQEEGMAGPGNAVCVRTADFIEKHIPLSKRQTGGGEVVRKHWEC